MFLKWLQFLKNENRFFSLFSHKRWELLCDRSELFWTFLLNSFSIKSQVALGNVDNLITRRVEMVKEKLEESVAICWGLHLNRIFPRSWITHERKAGQGWQSQLLR